MSSFLQQALGAELTSRQAALVGSQAAACAARPPMALEPRALVASQQAQPPVHTRQQQQEELGNGAFQVWVLGGCLSQGEASWDSGGFWGGCCIAKNENSKPQVSRVRGRVLYSCPACF